MRDLIRSEFSEEALADSPIARLKHRLKFIMTKAKRAGYWYGLSRVERSLYYLCLRLDVKFRSLQLAKAVVSVLKKLGEAGTTVLRYVERGRELVWLYSKTAVSWGNESARAWKEDVSYIVFVGRLFLNTWCSFIL